MGSSLRRFGASLLTAGLVVAGVTGAGGSASASVVGHDGPQGGDLHAASVSAGALPQMTGAQIVLAAEQWYVGQNNPPYSQSAYWQSPTVYAGDTQGDNPQPGGISPAWREDCSGFVAHAWGEADSDGGFTTFSVGQYSAPVGWSQLQPGDALLFNGVDVPGYGAVDHIGLFLGWDSPTTYSVMDETQPGTGTWVENGIRIGDDGFWQYAQPIRDMNIVPTGSGQAGPPSTTGGYWMTEASGGILNYNAPFFGNAASAAVVEPVVSMAVTPTGKGYYQVTSDGSVFAFGDARFAGSTGGAHLNRQIVGMAVDPVTGGYWLVASDGGIFAFNAPFLGSTGGVHLNQPITGIAPTADGGGYWLVASDGGIFAFGDARFAGSTGGVHLNQPIVGMTSDPATGGYWMVASDGGIFAFNAPFAGSTGGVHLNQPIVGMAPTAGSDGYWMVASDGGIFAFNAPFAGSAGGVKLSSPIVALSRGPS